MSEPIKMRCNRLSVFEQGGVPAASGKGSKVVTERSFITIGQDQKPLNGPEVQSASYSDSVVGDEQDLSVKLNQVVAVRLDAVVSPLSSPRVDK